MTYTFRRIVDGDLPLLNRWVARPHVARWWGDDKIFTTADLKDSQKTMWLASLDDRALAYVQDYAVHGFGPHHFAHLPPGARGIDQFIGEADLLDRGHGTALVRQQVARMFAAGIPAIGIDPHPDNARAIRTYEKAGFVARGGPVETAWGPAQLMELWPQP